MIHHYKEEPFVARVLHGEIQHPHLKLRFQMWHQSTWMVWIQRVVKVCTSLRDNLFIYYSLQSTPRLIILVLLQESHSHSLSPPPIPQPSPRHPQPDQLAIDKLQYQTKHFVLTFILLMVSYCARFQRYFQIYQSNMTSAIVDANLTLYLNFYLHEASLCGVLAARSLATNKIGKTKSKCIIRPFMGQIQSLQNASASIQEQYQSREITKKRYHKQNENFKYLQPSMKFKPQSHAAHQTHPLFHTF